MNGLNTAEEQYAEALAAKDVKKQISLQPALKFNGGGHINHTLFWESLSPEKAKGGVLDDGTHYALVTVALTLSPMI